MRNKLLLTAAVAAAMSFSAMADTVKIEKPSDFKDTPPEFEHNVPDHDVAEGKTPTERTELFGGGDGSDIGQQALIAQDGDANAADINQEGANNSLAHIRQDSTGEDAGNSANVTQLDHASGSKFAAGDATNVAIVGQTGGTNSADVLQEYGTNSTVEVHQTGNGNVFGVAGASNQVSAINSTSTVNQIGEGNVADSWQTDTVNSSISIQQGVAETADAPAEDASFNSAIAFQLNTADSSAAIEQTGQNNFASTDQTNVWGGEISIVQGSEGAGNSATATQLGDSNLDNSSIWIDQSGELNNAAVSQVNTFANTSALVVQEGKGNNADIDQTQGFAQEAVTGQFGDNNTATITQTNGSFNDAYIIQNGNNSDGVIEQTNSRASDAFISQYGVTEGTDGARNLAIATQDRLDPESDEGVDLIEIQQGTGAFGVAGNTAETSQERDNSGGLFTAATFQFGDGNFANIAQDRGGDRSATIVQGLADVEQSSVNNAATIEQIRGSNVDALVVQNSGSDNIATVSQENAWNTSAYVEQVGSGNVGTVTQTFGEANEAHLVQTGDYNDASISQYDAVWSTASIFQTGDLNTGSINQYGTYDATALIIQNGVANTANISQ